MKISKVVIAELTILTFLIIFVGMYRHFESRQFMIEGFESGDPSEPKYKLLLVYAEWCGHCKKMMPEWKKFEEKHPTLCKKYESEELDTAIAKKLKVSGYPTLVVVDENEEYVQAYEEDRTEDAFYKFIKSFNQSN